MKKLIFASICFLSFNILAFDRDDAETKIKKFVHPYFLKTATNLLSSAPVKSIKITKDHFVVELNTNNMKFVAPTMQTPNNDAFAEVKLPKVTNVPFPGLQDIIVDGEGEKRYSSDFIDFTKKLGLEIYSSSNVGVYPENLKYNYLKLKLDKTAGPGVYLNIFFTANDTDNIFTNMPITDEPRIYHKLCNETKCTSNGGVTIKFVKD